MVTDEPSETVRYLTGGVLIRLNRFTQELEPNLATSWKIAEGGRAIVLRLRQGVRFSDGTPFSSEDVAYTFRTLMDPATASPTADSFRSAEGAVTAEAKSPFEVAVRFPAPVAGMERLFDQVAILSAKSPIKERAVLGPFSISEYKPGSHVLLERNPNYWQRDPSGRALPYLDGIRLDIQQNRELELARFRRGELHLINRIDPEMFERLSKESPNAAHDAGPSLESEFMWFNQAPGATMPAHKRTWFQSREFRRAISLAIRRDDLCRIVYRGYARPAAGPVSPANRLWVNASLPLRTFNPKEAIALLERGGFRLQSGELRDRAGNPVEFSIITNSGNKPRERMAAMIQQDLAEIGIRLNVVALDFASLIERITKTLAYEACLLGLVNYDLDPNSVMNVWLSSASNHQWNPSQKTPATPWEAEIDRLMRSQASSMDPAKRKTAFDRVQRIVWEEEPFIYLVTKDALAAFSPALGNAQVAALHPQIFWNVERLRLQAGARTALLGRK